MLGKETLSYYKNNKSLKKVLGVISLRDITSLEINTQYKKKQDVLFINTPRRTYYVLADSKSILDEWNVAIQSQVDVINNKTQQANNGGDEKNYTEPEEKVGPDSFEMLTIIGQGSFGKVVQVRHKNTGDVYAMKILNKKNIYDRGEVEHTRTEKNILMRINHPFLMKLHYSFQAPDKLYLVMDFINGGELFYHLQSERKFSNDRARFYTAEIVLALEHLHKNGIIYRDLKPENILLDSSGHVKMTDFGLSKEGLESEDRTNTFCGTPEYLAPEVLDGKDYNKAVDWWSLGTLVFEMLTGLPPFYDEDVQKMYNKKMTAELTIPDYMDSKAKDLVRKLLDKNPDTRLQDPAVIKDHPYFQEINWDLLYRREIEPPYIPSVSSKDSTKMIDRAFTNLDVKREIKPGEELKGDQFEGFTFIRDKDGKKIEKTDQ